MEAWNEQMYTIRLFLQLIYDTDYNNINNLLVTPDWKIYKIDASRAFRNHEELRRETSLERFSRQGPRLPPGTDAGRPRGKPRPLAHQDPAQSRCGCGENLILELADRRVAEEGEEAVLFD